MPTSTSCRGRAQLGKGFLLGSVLQLEEMDLVVAFADVLLHG